VSSITCHATKPKTSKQSGSQSLHAADHLVDGAKPESRHPPTEVFGHEGEEVDHVLGLACEARA
jgi:hypothetical protein